MGEEKMKVRRLASGDGEGAREGALEGALGRTEEDRGGEGVRQGAIHSPLIYGGYTALMNAAVFGHKDDTRHLAGRGAEVMVRSRFGKTAHYVAKTYDMRAFMS